MGSESKYQVKTIQVKPKGQAEESKNESPLPPKRKKKKISRENTRVFTNPDQMSIPKGSCVVNPKKTGKWDAVMVICLIFTAIVTPYEVAFLDMSVINALWFINQLVNILFLIDMFINFFLAYFDDEALQWIVSKRLIAIRYLSGWFIIDFVSIFPFDYLVPGGSNLRALRIVRLLRLAKLLRVFRASRLIDRWQSRLSLGYGHMTMIKFGVFLIIVCHWLACFWRMVPDIELHRRGWPGRKLDGGIWLRLLHT